MGLLNPSTRWSCASLWTRRRKGFSFIEVLVVLAIITIGSTIALSTYAAQARQASIQTTSQRLKRAMVFAKQYAVSKNTEATLWIDLDEQIFWIDETHPADDLTLDPPPPPVVAKVLEPEQVPVQAVIDEVRVGSSRPTRAGRAFARFSSTGENPYFGAAVVRRVDDASDAAKVTTVLLHPNSSDPRILPRRRF
ncbi:MAG: prepilin-type N-terminal cleavage/methylation domain-containing protein [Candidatus Sumerlaeia bacterium]|nr:prepilin-type N-terminal cleavage/methylation domain-containing protein [Candidatus Sumerlaeia bacterium]